MEEHPLEIQGAWIVLLTKLWWSETRGEATKTLDEWSRILRETRRKTSKILAFFEQKHVADIKGLLNQNGNQSITIKSRRMVKDHEISQLRQRVGKLGGNSKLLNSEASLDNQNLDQNNPFPIPVPSPVPKKEESTSTNPEKNPEKPPKPPAITNDQIKEVVAFYKEQAGKNEGWQFTNKRRAKIKSRAEEAKRAGHDPVDYIKDCILGCVNDPWCSGDNQNNKKYVELEEHCIRSAEQAETRRNYWLTTPSDGKPKPVYTCSRPGCGVETENPWHVSGETVYCSQKCKEEAKG